MRAGEVARRAGVNVETLHVTNGDSAGNTLRQTSLGGAVLPWQDVLHAGPVPAGPRRELLQARAAFLAECGWGSRQAILSLLERRDRQLVRALQDREQVVLWFEHDLYDQLQLLDVLGLAATAGGLPELIVVGSFPGRPAFRGLGELTAGELETLWPQRVPASPDVSAAAAAAWDALRRSDPSALAVSAQADTSRGCRSSPRPCGGCSRSCRPRETACPGQNGGPCKPSRRARRRPWRPSWRRRTSRRRRSSATPGSTARSRT